MYSSCCQRSNVIIILFELKTENERLVIHKNGKKDKTEVRSKMKSSGGKELF